MERKLLDVTSHINSDGSFNRTAFMYDLGATAKETSINKPYWDRVHFYCLMKIADDWIIDARRGDKDVINFYSTATTFDQRESDVGFEMARSLVNYPPGTLAIHISPPGGSWDYPEGRIQIQLNQKVCGITFNICYGIPTPFPVKTHTYMGDRLTEISDGASSRTTEELRDQIFTIEPPHGVNPWEFISTVLPLEHVWEKIQSGQIIEESYRTSEHAEEVTEKALIQFDHVINSWDAIRFGAYAEQEMSNYGYQITGGNCGKSNMELLSREMVFIIKSKIDAYGKRKKDWSYHEGHCDVCKLWKEKVGPCGLCDTCEDLPEFN